MLALHGAVQVVLDARVMQIARIPVRSVFLQFGILHMVGSGESVTQLDAFECQIGLGFPAVQIIEARDACERIRHRPAGIMVGERDPPCASDAFRMVDAAKIADGGCGQIVVLPSGVHPKQVDSLIRLPLVFRFLEERTDAAAVPAGQGQGRIDLTIPPCADIRQADRRVPYDRIPVLVVIGWTGLRLPLPVCEPHLRERIGARSEHERVGRDGHIRGLDRIFRNIRRSRRGRHSVFRRGGDPGSGY